MYQELYGFTGFPHSQNRLSREHRGNSFKQGRDFWTTLETVGLHLAAVYFRTWVAVLELCISSDRSWRLR